eukprot:CAMPEP_0117692116 /NCGR_PEP_ID=MMETSP0804-20121206/26132_1 /TAXON_ID=1074897 /ORGANISM="Tetraselmis astigmatica, Strain CCMP880" /LENGTH=497 /DNA_ID=CAMNT_0005505495 /DNA_START=70 /DNA_END=1563 /DNA_ORIENTATION=+
MNVLTTHTAAGEVADTWGPGYFSEERSDGPSEIARAPQHTYYSRPTEHGHNLDADTHIPFERCSSSFMRYFGDRSLSPNNSWSSSLINDGVLGAAPAPAADVSSLVQQLDNQIFAAAQAQRQWKWAATMRQLHERPDHSAALGIDRLAAVWDSTASGSPSLSKLQSPGLHAHEPSKFFTVLEHCRPRDADSAQVQDNDDVGAALRKTGACRPPSTPPVPNLSDDVQVAVPGSQHSAFGDDMCAGKEASGLAVITETARCCWTPVLHERFMASVEQLGGLEVVKPAALLKHMGVPRLSLGHVKSHLQKCRKEHQRGIVPRPARSPRSKTLRPDKARRASFADRTRKLKSFRADLDTESDHVAASSAAGAGQALGEGTTMASMTTQQLGYTRAGRTGTWREPSSACSLSSMTCPAIQESHESKASPRAGPVSGVAPGALSTTQCIGTAHQQELLEKLQLDQQKINQQIHEQLQYLNRLAEFTEKAAAQVGHNSCTDSFL